MLLAASCASFLLTVGMLVKDYQNKKNREKKEAEIKERRSKF